MAYRKFAKQTSTIAKGQTEGTPVYIGGAGIRFLGLPVLPTGQVALNGTSLFFKGMFENSPQFQVLDYTGAPLTIPIKGVSMPHIPSGMDAAPAMLPVQDWILFEGLAVIIPVVDRMQSEEKSIDIYFEAFNP